MHHVSPRVVRSLALIAGFAGGLAAGSAPALAQSAGIEVAAGSATQSGLLLERQAEPDSASNKGPGASMTGQEPGTDDASTKAPGMAHCHDEHPDDASTKGPGGMKCTEDAPSSDASNKGPGNVNSAVRKKKKPVPAQ